jgi:hypothetical protein
MALEALLVYGYSGEGEFSILIEEIDSIPTDELVFFL